MAEQSELTGPDLAVGVPAADIPEGGSLLGHFEGEAVLLVRDRGHLLAVGATCTHYGGPLAKGLVVDGTVRCPWHHAVFDLDTGTAYPPAMDRVPCFGVEQRGGRVRVVARLQYKPQPLFERTNIPQRVVIVGAGAAGSVAAEELRHMGYEGEVILVGAEPSVPVDRPNLSKDYLAGTAPEEWVPLRDEAFYEENEIRFMKGCRATRLDVAGRELVLDDGTVLSYETLLLATGAKPKRLPVDGSDAEHVHTLRTWADSRAIIERAQSSKRAVIVGASFIGLEVAAALRMRDKPTEVTVVAPEEEPLARVLGSELGAYVRGLHESHGVTFRLGRTIDRIDRSQVVLDDGSTLPADFVVLGVGVEPDVELAESAGLAVDDGIVVDSRLRTSAEHVHAAGDVARFPDPRTGRSCRIEHWTVAQRMGRVAARNILGRAQEFTDVPFFWSRHYDQSIAYVGHAPDWDRLDINGSVKAGDCAIAYRKAGRTLAVATIGRDLDSLRAEVAIGAGDEETLATIVP